jgi:hypothetical protein
LLGIWKSQFPAPLDIFLRSDVGYKMDTTGNALEGQTVMRVLALFAAVGFVLGQQLLQPVPSQYANRSDIVYIANNLAVIPPPFNYTGGLFLQPFYDAKCHQFDF